MRCKKFLNFSSVLTSSIIYFFHSANISNSIYQVYCFQDVISEHPPLDCTEANMYLCFCKDQELQDYFLDCVWGDGCADEEEQEAVNFGVKLCSGKRFNSSYSSINPNIGATILISTFIL